MHEIADEAYAFSGIRDTIAPSLQERVEAIIEENSDEFEERNLNPNQQQATAYYMAQQEFLQPTINEVMDYLREIMESLSYEMRVNSIVLYDLVYPDIWLLYSGQQDVAQALASIQNKLELYVNE